MHPQAFTLTDGTRLHFNGRADRYHKNIAALTLLRELQRDERDPVSLSADERLTLAHYTSFGDSALLRRLFNGTDLEFLANEEEQARIKRTALTAFYTSTEVLNALWAALAPALRAVPGEIAMLEPAFGIGMVAATMPQDIRTRAAISAIELDHISSQIARYLHPDVRLYAGQGFEATELPTNAFDLVISNVPFGDMKIFDPRMPQRFLCRVIHDYFIARSLMQVRPGGLVAIMTSYGTLDKKDARTRAWLADRAELLTAVRLPQGVFDENAGTQCGADVLIFRRYAEGEEPQEARWIETDVATFPVVDDAKAHFTSGSRASRYEELGEEPSDDDAQLRVNCYWIDNPNQVVGTIGMVRHNGLLWQAITPPANEAISNVLTTCLAPLGVNTIVLRPEPSQARLTPGVQPRLNLANPRVHAMLGMHAAAKDVLRRDAEQHDASAERHTLNALYDAFVRQFGAIHHRANLQALKGEPELLFLKALETDIRTCRDGRVTAIKVALFDHPTVKPNVVAKAGDMPADAALLWCLDELGRVDLHRIAALSGATQSDVAAALRGRIFRNPATERWETADEYLSGNIRQKLAIAREAAEREPGFRDQIAALEAVHPAPLTPGKITVKFGAPWVPASDVRAFITTLVPEFDRNGGDVCYNAPLARWTVATGWRLHTANTTTVWGTARVNAIELFQDALNSTPPVVYDKDKDGKSWINQKETINARAKYQAIREKWAQWIWEDAARTDRLCLLYNTQFNSVRRRDFDGSHLRLSGLNQAVLRTGDLDPHQKDAVWMALSVPNQLVHLTVGGGKTFIGLTTAYEWKRLGLAKKPLIIVPNHLAEQWANEANRLYPHMRVLAMSAEDFSKERRGTFLSRIATEDWDCIICAHTSFEKIEIGAAANDFLEEHITELRDALADLEAETPAGSRTKAQKRTLKDIERKVQSLEVKLQERMYAARHDSGVILWEDLGIDALIVDEAHEYKNLMITTKLGTIPGIPTGDSQRAFDLRMKTWDMQRRNGRVVFMTATPILNTLGEVFVMQKFLQNNTLKALGIDQFDAWVATFADVQTVFEMTPDGGGFRMNTRLASFVNLPELFQPWFQMTFARSREQLQLPAPKLVTGKPIGVAVPGSPRLKSLVRSFVGRVDAIKRGMVDPWVDNMLKVTSDGRKAALDVRFFGGEADPVNKVETLCDHIAELYTRFDAAKATQLVFCELGTPSAKSSTMPKGDVRADADEAPDDAGIAGELTSRNGFVYNEIRRGLVERGIPEHEVAFIQEHATKTKRDKLLDDMNLGVRRILILSKQTTGLNVQKRLIAVHNVDAPWRPGDLEQRIGRAKRQGNGWPYIYVFNYATTGSFDGYVWQLIENKARFIEQFERGDVSVREIDDIGTAVLSAAEIKAIASGNPRIRRKVELDTELLRLSSLRTSFYDTQSRRRSMLWNNQTMRADFKTKLTQFHALHELLAAHAEQEFSIAIVRTFGQADATVYTKRDAAGEALLALHDQALTQATAAFKDAEEAERKRQRPEFGQKTSATRTEFDAYWREAKKVDHIVGRYRGLTIRTKASTSRRDQWVGSYLTFPFEDQEVAIPDYTVNARTNQGVSSSIDARLRAVPEDIARIEAALARLKQEDSQLTSALAQSWENEARFVELSDELDAINAELSIAEQAESAHEAAAATATESTEVGAPERDQDQTAVDIGETTRSQPNTTVVLNAPDIITMPVPVLIPEPEDPVAFAAAFTALIARTAADAEIDTVPTIVAGIDPALTFETTVSTALSETATMQPDVIEPRSTPTWERSVTAHIPVFGDTARTGAHTRTQAVAASCEEYVHVLVSQPTVPNSPRTQPPILTQLTLAL